MTDRPSERPRLDPHFFAREEDGSVRVRIRLTPERATAIENAAGQVPLMQWLNKVIDTACEQASIPPAAARPPQGPRSTPTRPTDDKDDL